MKWLQWMKRGADGVDRSAGPTNVAGILSSDAFERELQRHRALCNRARGEFILLVFEVVSIGPAQTRRAAIEKMAGVIMRRIRVSDVAGWFGEHGRRVGVILPQTNTLGAERFLIAVEELMRRNLNGSYSAEFKLRCEVFPYPEARTTFMVAATDAAAKPPVVKTN